MNELNKKIKVCFIAPKAYPLFNPEIEGVIGGAEVDLYLLATELAKDTDFDVSFITADYRQQTIENINNVKIIKSLDFKKEPIMGALKIWKAMKIADADIYFQETASWGTFLVNLFCFFYKRKFIYRTAHQNDCDGTYLRQKFFAGKAFRWALRQAAQVVVQNEKDKEGILKTIGIDSIVIPNAHYIPELSETQRDTILWVGRSADFKRPQLFIKLAQVFPDEKFTFICQRATDDRIYDHLTSEAEKIQNLIFIEKVPFHEIDSYFQRAKVFVCTSQGEGFPNTYVQACKNATPIVSLAVNPDDFLNKHNCGLCADDNWDLFIQKLKQIIDTEKQKKLGQNARKYAQNKHDIKKIGEEYKKLFQSLTQNG
jgi:glycosyltransferase involved in cell wall biosynthesis